MNNTKTYTVYAHVNKITGMTYIGVTSLDTKIRWGKEGRGYKKNEEFKSDIETYGWNNFDHLILAITKDKTTASILESKLIEKYSELGKCYNLQTGGYSKFKVADSTRKKRSGANNYQAKKVIQINKTTGEVIRNWNCINDAVKFLGIDHSGITKACQGKLKTSGGFIWVYYS